MRATIPVRASNPPIVRLAAFSLLLLVAGACERPEGCTGDYCGTLVIATAGEPESLLPPVAATAVAQAVSDQLFLKLADIGLSTNTVGDEDFQAQLAERWEWADSLTLVFHLDPRARWQDGRAVTAVDVAFTFDAYNDPAVNSPFRSTVRSVRAVTARDSLTAVFRFRKRYPEMLFDAVYQLRILPAHLLRPIPRDQWRSAPFGRQPVGNGPYRFVSWKAGEHLELAADSTFYLGRPHIRRVIWRFTPDLQVAVTQLLADQADAIEVLGPPDNLRRARAAPQLTLYPYRGATYGYLGFNLAANGDSTRPHPLFGERELRRALVMAVDRERLLTNVWGDAAKVPPGPVPQLWWIWDSGTRTLPYDTAQAGRLLTRLGWRDADKDGVREREGHRLAFRIMVPTSSAIRRQYARLLQEQYRALGAEVELDEVEPNVFFQRAMAGRFDALIASWNADPTPASSIAQTWTQGGLGRSNYLRYVNPAFEEVTERATSGAGGRVATRYAWRAALELLNQDAPAVFLFASENVAAVHRRVADVTIRPDSWLALLRTWRIPADRLIERDRVER
jgi:peptide/nickel transport system substrate-binding protein